jgi:hypothetical protein
VHSQTPVVSVGHAEHDATLKQTQTCGTRPVQGQVQGTSTRFKCQNIIESLVTLLL